jgi:predicted nuclease of predicted toxin-antitoxin system
VRFLLDEAIQHRLAGHLAEAGHDATHVVRIGLAGAPDPKVLERAAAEDRILITTDTDFPTLLALSGEPIPSVLLLRGIGDSTRWSPAAHHQKALTVVAARLAERAWTVMARGTPYVICDLDGTPVDPTTARQLIAVHYTVPPEVRAARRSRKPARRAGKAPHPTTPSAYSAA